MKKYYRCKWEDLRDNPYIKAAMNFTKADIQKFNHYMWLIKQDIPMTVKKDMVDHLKTIQNGIMQLQQILDQDVFDISYKHFFQGVACHVLAEQCFLDKSTVVKQNQKFILKLAEILYPQYFEWMKKNE